MLDMAHLEVGGQEGVGIGLPHMLGHLGPKHVVHDAGALVEVVQPRHQGPDGGHVMRRVQAPHLSDVAGRVHWPKSMLDLCQVQASNQPYWLGQMLFHCLARAGRETGLARQSGLCSAGDASRGGCCAGLGRGQYRRTWSEVCPIIGSRVQDLGLGI